MVVKILRRKSVSIANSRWAAYATAGAATALAGANSAEAGIHYSGPLNISVNNSVTAHQAFDMAADFFTLGHSGSFNGGFAGFYIKGAVSAMFRGSAAGSTGQFRYPSKLGSGINVSAPGAFVANNGTFFATLASVQFAGGQWRNAGTGFVGFKFNGGSGVEYGWVRLSMNGSGSGNTFTLVDYAYGDVGTPILTGQIAVVPEPGSLGLLALGATGLLVWRRSRSKAPAQA
jgi:PEP-CTERM motif